MNKKLKKHEIILLILTIVLAFVLFLTAQTHIIHEQRSGTNESTIPPSINVDPNSIAIPGYEILQLSADTKKQTICFSNPQGNPCYFQISLYLEDGTLLWESELIEPGKTSRPIVLINSLPKGTYTKAVLRYSCYSLDEALTPMNGAETKVTLRVK